jgi:hypothetical protein
MPRNGQSPGWVELDEGDPNWSPEPFSGSAGRKTKKQKIEKVCDKLAPGVEEGIEVKTKFPVARIKRIMQADEDVGKVSQVTPTAVCESFLWRSERRSPGPYADNDGILAKALELFMISLVTKAANEAKSKSSKRVTAAHLKQACERDDQWDFLASIMEKVPDAAHAKKEDDSEETGDGRRKKGGPRRRKRDSDEH